MTKTKIIQIFILLTLSIQISSWKDIVRRLIGSNCVQIQRGEVPEYYHCLGCVMEEAIACVDDMRQNKSSNVFPGCDMNKIMGYYESSLCCPRVGMSTRGRLGLLYISSAYPETLRCIRQVGCENTNIYAELRDECQNVCPANVYGNPTFFHTSDPCFAEFNSASKITISAFVAVISVLLCFQLLWI